MAQQTFFSFFGLSPLFAIDLNELEARHIQAMKKVHPDLFADRPAAERRVAQQWSTRLNEAYQTLKDPVKRASYLCQLAGFDVGAETNTDMPMDFLMTQMQWRETFEQVQGDAEQSQQLASDVQKTYEETLTALRTALDEKHDYEQAVNLTRQLMFIAKFKQQLQQASKQ